MEDAGDAEEADAAAETGDDDDAGADAVADDDAEADADTEAVDAEREVFTAVVLRRVGEATGVAVVP